MRALFGVLITFFFGFCSGLFIGIGIVNREIKDNSLAIKNIRAVDGHYRYSFTETDVIIISDSIYTIGDTIKLYK